MATLFIAQDDDAVAESRSNLWGGRLVGRGVVDGLLIFLLPAHLHLLRWHIVRIRADLGPSVGEALDISIKREKKELRSHHVISRHVLGSGRTEGELIVPINDERWGCVIKFVIGLCSHAALSRRTRDLE